MSGDLKDIETRCVRCGACLSVCPIYEITRHERLSPRGKYRLLTEIVDNDPNSSSRGQVLPTKVLETLRTCLQCGACRSVCPAGVEVDALVRKAKARHNEGSPIPIWMLDLLRGHRLTPLLARIFASIPGTSGLVWRMLGLAGHTSTNKKRSHFVMPALARRPALARKNIRRLAPNISNNSGPGPRVAFFVGCIQNYLYPEVAEAIIQCLEGRLLVPLGQGCCGMPAWSAGAMETAKKLAIQNIRVFEAANADFILTGCAACAAMIKKWPELFNDQEPERETAIKLAGKVMEFSQFIKKLMPLSLKVSDEITVTYHAPCHQRFDLGGVSEVEELLDRMFSEKFRPMPNGCCGQGGLLGIEQPELVWKIFEKRLSAWRRTDSSIVVTTCSGCLLQWRAGTANQSRRPRVLHLAELLANSIRNRR